LGRLLPGERCGGGRATLSERESWLGG